MDFIIRAVNPAKDAKRIAEIYNHFIMHTCVTFEIEPVTAEQMEERISRISATHPYLVSEADGEVIGFAYVHEWNPKAAYRTTAESTIYIMPTMEGRGLGAPLLRHLEDECRRVGIEVIVALITADNARSIRFHERMGYERVGYLRHIGQKFGAFLDVAIYQRLLPSPL